MPLAVPASRISCDETVKKKKEKEKKKNTKRGGGEATASAAAAAAAAAGPAASLLFDARSLLPRWCLDAVLHGPPPPPASTSSSAAAAAASTKMAFALEPHPKSNLPQLAPRRLSAPKVLSLVKVAAHARAKLSEPPHSIVLAEEPLACFWDEGRQVEAERAEEEEEEEGGEDRGDEMDRGDGGEAAAASKRRNQPRKNKQPPPPPRLELCIGEFAAPLDLSLASAREHIWRHVGGNGGIDGDMVLWYRRVANSEPRSTRPLLGPE